MELIPIDRLTMDNVTTIAQELERGGVIVYTIEEFLTCIRLLDEVGFLTLQEENQYYRITKKYGK